ncbi:MAG: ATP-binding protein, partial [Candidatus Aminicenantes bacterium]
MDRKKLKLLVSGGESEILEFKKSTGQLRRAAETLCGMLNGTGGRVLIGVTPEGRILGQTVSDKTIREVAELLQKFEPPGSIDQDRVNVADNKAVLVLEAIPNPESRPYAFNGRPYQRIGSTTSIMPQETYQRLLNERAHSRIRWENQPAGGYDDTILDSEEILRTVRLGIAAGRLPESTGNAIPDILKRLRLLRDGRPNQASVVLFGSRFMPDYPQ